MDVEIPGMDQEAFATFWYWINERQNIFIKKSTDHEKPWSDDPIFQNWKFCNVFRTQDRQTEWLMGNVIDIFGSIEPARLLFNIYAFRAFNWHPTYELLCNSQTGLITSWNAKRANEVLSTLVNGGGKLTSGAYMIRGRQHWPKFQSIVETLDNIWAQKNDLLAEIQDLDVINMQNVYRTIMLRHYWGWGPFTTYQVVLDLTYSPILSDANDINTWCEFGPGAKRGLRCIWPGLKNGQMLERTRFLYQSQGMHLKEHMPIMTLQDIEFSLCELSKYMRLKRGGKSKEKYDGR